MTNLVGRIFEETWMGMSVTSNYTQCEKVWKVLEETAPGRYKCVLLHNSTSMGVPENCTSEFTESEILAETLLPIDNWYSQNEKN